MPVKFSLVVSSCFGWKVHAQPTPKSRKSNDSAWNIRSFWYMKHFLFLKWLGLNALVLPNFYLKSNCMLCSVPSTSSVGESPLTPVDSAEQKHHEIESVVSWWLYQYEILPTIAICSHSVFLECLCGPMQKLAIVWTGWGTVPVW